MKAYERRSQIENLYQHLELVRLNMRSLINDNIENLTSDNLYLLEMEEEKLINKIIKLKTILEIV